MANKVTLDSSIIEPLESLGTPAWVIAVLTAPNGVYDNLDARIQVGGKIYRVGEKIKGAYLKSPVSEVSDNSYTFEPFEDDNALSATIRGESDTGARYSFYLTDSAFKVLVVLAADIIVPDTLEVTTIPALRIISGAERFLYPLPSYVTNNDFYVALAALNDMSQTATTLSKGAVKIDTLGAETAVATTNPIFLAIQQTKYVAGYASFSAAIDAIGSVTKTNLIYTSDTPVTANKTVPANISLIKQGNGVLNISSGVTLTIANGHGFSAPPDRQVFTGAGSVVFSTTLPERMHPEWFGAVGDGVTDDLAAFNKFSTCAASYLTERHIILATGKTYYLSDDWEFDFRIVLESEGSDNPTGSLLFPVNKRGIVAHHGDTETGSASGKSSAYTIIRHIGVVGNGGNPATYLETHTVDVSGLTVTKTDGDDFTDAGGYHEGNTVTLGTSQFTYMIDELSDASNLTIKKIPVQISCTNGSAICPNSTGLQMDNSGLWTGQNIIIDGTTYTISSCTLVSSTYRITLTTNFTGTTGSYTGYVQSLAATAGLSARFNLFHGIDIKSNFRVEGCRILYFAGNGINLDTSAGLGNPNANTSVIEKNLCYQNSGNGIYTRGINSNVITFISGDCTLNRGSGVFETSFLGNAYIGTHTSVNYLGSFWGKGANNYSTFTGCYSEGSQEGERFGVRMIRLGGTPGAGFSDDNEGVYIASESGRLTVPNLFISKQIDSLNTKAWTASFGASNLANSIFGFGAGEEDANTAGHAATNAQYPAFQLIYNRVGNGIYSLHYKTDQLGTDGTVLLYFTGSEAADGGGKVYFPNSFYIGSVALNATATEINQLNDVSAYQESRTTAGALSVTKVYSGLALASAGAVTLAAPDASMLGQQKTIEMTADNGDVTLALTNCEGQSSGTTATFTAVGQKLILMAGASKWAILKEIGVTMS